MHRFRVAFGALGLENLGQLGDETPVDPRFRVADGRRALEVILEGSLIGLAISLVVAVIPS